MENKRTWVVEGLVTGLIGYVTVMGVFAAEIVHLLSWRMILAANLGAGLTAGSYLWWRHAQLWRELTA